MQLFPGAKFRGFITTTPGNMILRAWSQLSITCQVQLFHSCTGGCRVCCLTCDCLQRHFLARAPITSIFLDASESSNVSLYHSGKPWVWGGRGQGIYFWIETNRVLSPSPSAPDCTPPSINWRKPAQPSQTQNFSLPSRCCLRS